MTANEEELMAQIAAWHEEDNHFKIIEAVSEIPESERSYELTCLWARACNNTDDFEKALALLLSVEEEGRHDLMWHFRIGYAYYYLDQLEAAEKAFERVLQSDSGNSDAQEFLEWTREEIKEAADIKPAQEKAALEEMIHWLSQENELGQAPAAIEPAGEFDLHGLHYYIYKYKKTAETPWLMSVAGGYGRRDLQHCDHVFSTREEYDAVTAEEKAATLVEMLRAAMEKESQQDGRSGTRPEDGPRVGPFAGFVLLDSYEADMELIKAHLKNDWEIHVCEKPAEDDISEENALSFDADGMTAAIRLVEAPVPNGEAEHFAATNYLWPDAVEKTKTHVAQILIAVMDCGMPAVEAARLYTKVAASCLKLENAVGIYTSGTVFQPEFYIDVAELMNEGDLPILNWIYLGVYTTEKGTSGYTYGLRMFGKEEIEILDSTAMPETIHDFLIDIAYYILSQDVTLEDGETVGFTEFQKLKITRSKGVALDGYTLKIEY